MTLIASALGLHVYRAGQVYVVLDDERRFHSVHVTNGTDGFVTGAEYKRRKR